MCVQALNTFIYFSWDTYQDWGLLRPKHRLSRLKSLYPRWTYSIAVLANLLLRCFWVYNTNLWLKGVLGISSLHPAEQVALSAAAEILRRNIHSAFTLERMQTELTEVVPPLTDVEVKEIKVLEASNRKDVQALCQLI